MLQTLVRCSCQHCDDHYMMRLAVACEVTQLQCVLTAAAHKLETCNRSRRHLPEGAFLLVGRHCCPSTTAAVLSSELLLAAGSGILPAEIRPPAAEEWLGTPAALSAGGTAAAAESNAEEGSCMLPADSIWTEISCGSGWTGGVLPGSACC